MDTVYLGTKNFRQQDVRSANATGFGAASDDFAEKGIDLNEQLLRNKPATFFVRVRGEAMINAGIHDGDVVIVDRGIKASNGKVIISTLNGEMLIRRLEKGFNNSRLIPETQKPSPIDIDHCAESSVWGVVTYVILAV
jgi:DNA polymerase V